jgi:phosphoribosylglycinamide formyltransferase 1
MKRLAILLSGRGSNFAAIADAIAAGQLQAEIAVVISNNPEAAGLDAARQRGIPAVAIPSKGVERGTYDSRVLAELAKYPFDLICLAGYMRLLTPTFVRTYLHKIVNIHPSLLPSFPGLNAQQQALHYGVKVAGCTVHFVDQALDSGPIILQAAVPVEEGDSAATLSARILKEEHRIYSQAIAQVLTGKFRIEGRRVVFE